MPSSLRRGMMWSFTMITFLKESLMFVSERDKDNFFVQLYRVYIKTTPLLAFFYRMSINGE